MLFLWQLGSTGLVDETPPLFASAARAMAKTGDWLTPRVNGLPRYDKPPLVYWFMAFFYGLPGHIHWDPLGTWAARLPSALSTLALMCALGDTVMRWPQPGDKHPRRTGVVVALAFGLSPLVLLWSRTAVSDPLLCCTLGLSLLIHWRRYAFKTSHPWWLAWAFLGLAVLTKGPVAVILTGLVLLVFGCLQKDLGRLWKITQPCRGLLVTLCISLPWYLAELIVEGEPFWKSFFGYHNFQRFTSVVNSHLQPWWFFIPMMLLASLPFTPFLIYGLFRSSSSRHFDKVENNLDPPNSLNNFAKAWLLSILLFFTFAATKLPSYWLPATPAAALLVGLCSTLSFKQFKAIRYAWTFTILILILLSIILLVSADWIQFISDPEMPSLGSEIVKSGLALRGALIFSLASAFGIIAILRYESIGLLPIQLMLMIFSLTTLVPLWSLGDDLRHFPVRKSAEILVKKNKSSEPFAMVGVMKPSLHFYTGKVVIYEGRSPQALVNLEDRIRNERRDESPPKISFSKKDIKTILMVIDKKTSEMSYWVGLRHEVLGEIGIYRIWRVELESLSARANKLKAAGTSPDWMNPRPERY